MRKISVIQPGARLHYAVPQIFAQAGLLNFLYTDLHADHAFLKPFAPLGRHRNAPAAVRRLFGRRLPDGLPPRLVRDMPIRALQAILTNEGAAIAKALLRKLEAASLGEGDAVYTVLVNEDLETMRRLKDRGVKIIHECMIGPDVGLHLIKERQLFPGVEPVSNLAEIEAGRASDREKYALSDLILVPSDFARSAVRNLASQDANLAMVPYGLNVADFEGIAQPKKGRVLFVGAVGLRKGNPYLAEAARQLARSHPWIEVQVVGKYDLDIISMPAFKGPTYLGAMPRAQVAEAFQEADVFVLPTIADSFALVHLEAMAAGVPVITTPHCGSTVRDGVEGFIVPIRDARALTERIIQIVEDRDLRAQMSGAARKRAAEFSLDQYRSRLLSAVLPILEYRP